MDELGGGGYISAAHHQERRGEMWMGEGRRGEGSESQSEVLSKVFNYIRKEAYQFRISSYRFSPPPRRANGFANIYSTSTVCRLLEIEEPASPSFPQMGRPLARVACCANMISCKCTNMI